MLLAQMSVSDFNFEDSCFMRGTLAAPKFCGLSLDLASVDAGGMIELSRAIAFHKTVLVSEDFEVLAARQEVVQGLSVAV